MRVRRRLNATELDAILQMRGSSKTHKDYKLTRATDKYHAQNNYQVFLSEKESKMLDVMRAEKDVVSEQKEKIKQKQEISTNNSERDFLLKKIILQEEILGIRAATENVKIYDIVPKSSAMGKETISISLLSDVHIEEVVLSDSVLGLNQYNPEIAKSRLDNYFINLVKLVNHHQRNYSIKKHILALLGDIIGGFIHDELKQTNSMTPLEAISYAKSCLISGFKYLQDNLNVETIDVVCSVGNHGRNTDKIQFSNITETSYEWFLYEDLKMMCEVVGLNKFKFINPRSGFAIVSIFGEKYMFTHGNLGFSYKGGVGGLYVPFLRYFGKVAPTFGIKRIFFGHYHTTIDIKEGVCNGSVKGYDSYAMSKGLPFEPPQQSMVLLNEKRGFTNFQSIFLD